MDTAASAGFSFETTGTDGYAIPINSALAIVKKIELGQASTNVHIGPTAFLGVKVYSTQSGSSPSGAVIDEVLPGSPAASAGLVVGDVITSLGGNTVRSAPALTSLMQLRRPGDRVQVGWTDSAGGRHSTTLRLTTGPAG
jgi:S1-C subfamily serine protease